MPERTDRSLPPAVTSDRGGIRHLIEHIRIGRALVERFGTRRDDEANEAFRAWQDRARELLRFVFIAHELYEAQVRSLYRRMCVRHLLHPGASYRDLASDLRDLESIVGDLAGSRADTVGHLRRPPGPGTGGKVLVVHGRNHEVREQVARFLMRLELEPVLLDEQAAMGRTLIEKLEAQAGVSFAVVILTGDDLGRLAGDPRPARARARQNVIFELGFAVGQLGRDRVCALYQEGVELPSDIQGVEYTPLDRAGVWRGRLARELHEAGFRFDPLRALA